MSNPLSKVLFSTRLMAVLFVVFAISMATGTFVENSYNIETARIYIYNTLWFEAIMVFFAINFMGNIVRYRLHKKEKWSVLLLHLSFLFIIIGAGITRYLGDEGVLPLREGETADFYLSERTYLSVFVDGKINGEDRRKPLQDDFLFSEYANNDFTWKYDFNGQPFTVEYVDFVHGAKEGFVTSENGEEYLKIVEAGDGTRHEHFLKNGTDANIHNIIFSLNKPSKGAINIRTTAEGYTIESPFDGTFMRMADQMKGELIKDTIQPLMLRSLYQAAGMSFVIPDSLTRGNYDIVPIPDQEVTKNDQDMLEVKVTTNGESRNVKLMGGKGVINDPETINLGGLDFHLSFGSIRQNLPFSVKLDDFIAEKYPGTEKSYSSYMSKVTVEDDKPFAYDIYMNHILDYKGYRLFQSSFMPDEKGTILSVNHDALGTTITYIGYYLLYAGLLAIMFLGKTRFKDLGEKLKKVMKKRKSMTMLLLLMISLPSMAQDAHNHVEGDDHEHEFRMPTDQEVMNNIHATTVDKEHAAKFGALVIQDDGGRMKPVNTFGSELLRKLSEKSKYEDLDANQVLLSMMQNPTPWYHVPFIFIEIENDSLHHVLGVEEGLQYVKAIDFFDERGNYKLEPFLDDAYNTNTPNQFEKEYKKVDLKLALLNRALSGEILKIYPIPNDENNKWISRTDFMGNPQVIQDSLYTNFVKNSLPYYTSILRQSKLNGDYSEADKMLEAFKKNQHNYGKEVMPTDDEIQAELTYNKYNVFRFLFLFYMLVGTVLFVLLITQIFKDNKWIRGFVTFFKLTTIILFLIHTAGLAARWYISGHAPWSNAYESMIYVGWATMGIGLMFYRKSDLTVAATVFVTCIILMIAQGNWVDPEIGNLQPVLNSYWLMVHVAVIVASYGPFTLNFILGLVTLLLYIIGTKKAKPKIELAIQELTIINELAMTVGLAMLTIGNFLGGQWANESWGRYWGWDPKETWALISIMVYAFVVHMRLVPGLRGRFAFNVAAVYAYASIMMTYFGVNFYLSGLHSYASGHQIITPTFVWITLSCITVFVVFAYWRYKVTFKK
ncbi:cytochrome c-type biogenesis protein CcsB [Pustulibacterium marinum]|uniref:Cytochrome c-type biogenesis protein CcsB n=1 Tax=Pustulibacterium marinum TaxID=1224947 RepID=A0A1I7H781_9FLAO|nr:cytochrome c biogenesis protein CcsA [Pustulibacterium marinum]SFU56550.1 cytochrome c-type biogenesis protein CcsB [Pustulibacterium marinum]